MDTIPKTIGRFRIESLLGRGAMGVVYKAHDPHIDRIVAIKLVRADLLDGESRGHYLARFHNEARTAGRCVHPNIVAIHDFSEHEGNPFLVLEYIDGCDLGRAFPRGTQMEVAQAIRIALHVLDALSYAHRFGVVHRDIKPANIMLTAGDAVKVTDFGISRIMSVEATMSSVLVGTPCYMSPEQCVGGEVDARSDLFSLACVLYELLSGRRAFEAANFVATMHNLIHGTPPPLDELRGDLPEALVRVIERAFEKDPNNRFRDAAEMATCLRAATDAGDHAGNDDATRVWNAAPSEAPGTDHAAARSSPGSRGAAVAPSASMASIERRLAHHVGPMARYHVRQAIEIARSPGELSQLLAEAVPDAALRPAFMREIDLLIAQDPQIAPSLSRSSVPALPPAIDPAEIERVEHALAQVLGPIAPRLLRRVLPQVSDGIALRAACAALIALPRERERFQSFLE